MDIRGWRGGTAKLYLALLYSPGQCGSQAELMARMGTTDKHTFLAARRELEEVGKAHLDHGLITLTGVETTPAGMETIPVVVRAGVETTPVGVESTPPGMESTPEAGVETTPSPRTRCAEADRSGERVQQLKALSFAFNQHFPATNMPSVESLKRLLQLSGNSAEVVDDAFERAAARKPEYPLSYVRSMLEKAQPAAPSQPTATAEDLPEPTAEDRARWKRAQEAMVRQGILPADGGDRWD